MCLGWNVRARIIFTIMELTPQGTSARFSLDLEELGHVERLYAPHFQTPEQAREWLEKLRWPEGPICSHCGTINHAYKTKSRAGIAAPRKSAARISRSPRAR